MPQAAAAFAAWAAGALTTAEVSTGVYTAVYVGAYAAAIAAESYALQQATAYAAKQQADDAGRFQSREVNVASAKAPQTVVYGESWCGGVLMYANSRHVPASKDNYEVYKVVAHCVGEIQSITDIYYDNDILVDTTNINWGTGNVTSGKYGILAASGDYAVKMERYYGTTTQTASPLLTGAFNIAAGWSADDWISTYRARGYAYTVHRWLYFSGTAKTAENIFSNGVPQQVRAKIKGRKVYDPRLDTTAGGSGSHRVGDSTTWAWSDNPILCCADYMLTYMGIASTRIDYQWVRQQADVCDVLVPIPTATTGKRYLCNGVISLGNTHRQNLDAIMGSCAGTYSKVNGKWRPTAGGYIAPDVSLSEADIVGEISMTGSVQREERYNNVVGVYFSEADYGQEVDSLPMTLTAYQTRDGQKLDKTLALSMVNTEYQAQRLAYKHLLQSDQQITCSVPLRWTGLQLAIGTRVSLSYAKYGWLNKSFRCTGFKMGGESPVSVVLREDALSAWADPTEAQYSTRSAQGIVTLGTTTIPQPPQVNGSLISWMEDFSDNSLGRVQAEWFAVTTNGEETIQNETGTPPPIGGTYVWQFGNNSGSDDVTRYLQKGRSIAIDSNVLYRMTWVFRRSAGAAVVYLGVIALSGDRSTSLGCASNGGNNHHFAAAGYAPPSTAWVTRTSYFMNDGASGGDDRTGTTTPQSPGLLNSSTRYVSPLFFANYTAAAGTQQIAYIALERIGAIGDDIRNSEAVTTTPATFQWLQDSTGAWPAGNPTHDSTVTFYRNGSSIATHVVRFSLTTATGVATAASLSTTGEATTYSESGDPTAGTGGYITCTITHTSSNTLGFANLITGAFTPAGGGGGGVGK